MKTDADAYRRLIEIGRALSAEKDIDSLLERILREARSMVNADAGTLYLVTPARQLEFAIVLNDTLAISQGGISGDPVSLPEIPLQTADGSPNLRNIAARVANSGEAIRIDDVYAAEGIDTSGTRHFDELTGYRSTSFLTVPLSSYHGETIGVLQLLNAMDERGEVIAFTAESMPLIEALASLASVALENRYLLDEQEALKRQLELEVDDRTKELKGALEKLSRAHNILKEITTIDPVTGIRNRQYFDDVFEQEWRRAERQKYPLTLLLIDIDHFKRVNDTWGHLAGDQCLRVVAGEIDSMFNRPSDVVARFGGEEFVIILPYVEYANALHLAEQVRKRIADQVIDVDETRLSVTISVGVASMVPVENMQPKSLIGEADAALYVAKAGGRNAVAGARS
ncbi:MAG: diguanylate cyclase [Pseudomonadota bacterium]